MPPKASSRACSNVSMARARLASSLGSKFWFGQPCCGTIANASGCAAATGPITDHSTSPISDLKVDHRTKTTLSPAEHDAFAKITQPVYDKWKKQIGVDLVNLAEKSIAARKK